jgi:hemolysin activation/secretion protein
MPRTTEPLSIAAALFSACLLFTSPAAAQDHSGATVVVPVLKGLVFVSNTSDFQKDGVDKPGITLAPVKMLDSADFRDRMSANIGKPLTFDGLNQITHSVVAYYREHHRPLVDAVAPAQNVQNGVIQIVVTEFRVGEVKVEGNNWFSDRVVTAPLTLQHGDIVDSAKLINQLDAANTNPFRRVDLVYQPSAQPGFTDVVLKTQDRLPLRFFAGFDNSGPPATTRSRWDLGVTWGNALWHDQQLSYQFSSSDDFFTGRSRAPGEPGGPSFAGHSLTWSMPVRGRDSISLSGSFERSIPILGQDFGLVGESVQAGFRYNLALRRTGSLIHTLQFGYDFKSTNNNLDFGGTQVSRNRVEIDQFPLGYAANLVDRWGSSAFTTSVVFSPGRLTPHNNDADFQPANGQSGRDMASARYTYWRSDFTRLTKLPVGAVWSSRIMGQTSTSNLLFTEQLAAGGQEILRGYDPNSILGDRGIVISNELRTPSLFKKTEGQFGQLQFLGFWDWAHLGSVNDVAGAVNHLNASSVGVGTRYNFRSNLTGRFDYGWQLQHLPNAGARSHLASIALIVAY